MKKLIIVLSTRLSDDGRLNIKNQKSLNIILDCLKENYEVTLLVQNYRDKYISGLNESGVYVNYDSLPPKDTISAFPSRFQIGYDRWTGHVLLESEYDCLIAWDGCSPWCLATALTCVDAKRRILWLHNDPALYLMTVDHRFYACVCDSFDSVIVPDQKTERSLADICGRGSFGEKAVIMRPPVDIAWYLEQSHGTPDWKLQADEINLLAISRMSVESEMEHLPYIISQLCGTQLNVHGYLIGEGNRLNHYFQQVAICDVDSAFTFLGVQKNPYPYILACDILVICENERMPEMELAAEIFGTPVMRLDTLHQTKLKKKKKFHKKTPYHWADCLKLKNILEGEINS